MQSLKCTALTFFIALVYTLLPVSAQAESIEVATDYWPPFRMTTASGDIIGLDVELMEEIGNRMGLKFEFIRYPWARCLTNLKSGESDFMTGLAKTPDRETFIAYTTPPYYTCHPTFYTQKGMGQTIQSYADLQGHEVGYVRASKYFDQFDNDTTLSKQDLTDEKTMLRMLVSGRLGVIIGTDCQITHDIQSMGLGDKVEPIAYKPDVPIHLYIGISRNSPYLRRMNDFNAILAEMISDGTIEMIAARYFTHE
ncbi:substrate-binding periplasmic protein [Desulfovibrio ferrophilus]|uniref:Extracellular solute-binding protein family 3 n=1 Tax=Desulfovibrio ferrophilus TaxID=241368 RepID=A0A2Z6B238_9BACT|nr:transporter substrate-binding domain-containing protein [Desulfovibrio ferrophilus]BBD09513.1 extracellular solute-binding protein family 3 [Desulfovibrio ferrophilus]